jgi:hypothetical protein
MNTELESQSTSVPEASEDRHPRKCTICNHPDRESIDEAFLHWSRSERIVRDYNLPSVSALYRHAHACGLWNLRRTKIRRALDRVIEQAAECRPSGNAVLRAIEISVRFDQDDRYVEPNKKVIIEHHTVASEPNPNRKSNQATPRVTPTKQTKAPELSNREALRLENDVTPTKQSPDPNPNRELEALLSAPQKTALGAAMQNMLLGISQR